MHFPAVRFSRFISFVREIMSIYRYLWIAAEEEHSYHIAQIVKKNHNNIDIEVLVLCIHAALQTIFLSFNYYAILVLSIMI